MDNKNIIIIILICILIALSISIIAVMQSSQTPANQTINSTDNTSVNVEKIGPDDEKSSSGSGGTHTEHLIIGDVEVDENGMVVGSYNSKGEYFPGGQMGGMTIEEARAFDEHASKYGLT